MGDVVRNVFISYARQDALEFTTRLANDLRQAGHNVLLDLTDIEKGGLWEVRLEESIRNSDVLASVMTVAAVRPDSVCRDEVVFALNEGKSIIPLKLDPSPTLKPSLLLARRNWIDFSTDYNSGLQSMLRHFRAEPGGTSTTGGPHSHWRGAAGFWTGNRATHRRFHWSRLAQSRT